MSMFASPADYWRARAERAEAGLVAAANGAIAALSLPGAPTQSEREEIIASLRAAIAPHDGREQWGAWFANTTDDELRAIFAARPDLAARLAAVLDAAVEPTAAPAPAQGSDERLDRAYSERNALAVAFAKMALAAGWRAGRSFDAGAEKDWRDEWRHVVYVDVPGVGQVSWHMAPAQVPLLEGLPTYAGEWDGTFLARNTDWCAFEPASAAQGGEAVIYYAANVEHGGDFNHIPISMFDQPAIFLSKEKAEQFCSFANGTGSRHEARSLALRSIALPAAASGLAEAECIAIYDAVTRSNLTRDVKTDERKVAVVRGAQ